MPTLDDFNEIDHDAVLDAMSERGLAPGWEYPGCAVIDITPRVQVWTGLHTYGSGDLSWLNVFDNMWEPLDVHASLPINEYETDPELIAAAWARWVEAMRYAVARSKREINDDIASGQTPEDVPDFSTLHDYADANEYGGLCDEPFEYRDVFGFDGLGIDNCNALQYIIDRWLREGRPEGF